MPRRCRHQQKSRNVGIAGAITLRIGGQAQQPLHRRNVQHGDRHRIQRLQRRRHSHGVRGPQSGTRRAWHDPAGQWRDGLVHRSIAGVTARAAVRRPAPSRRHRRQRRPDRPPAQWFDGQLRLREALRACRWSPHLGARHRLRIPGPEGQPQGRADRAGAGHLPAQAFRRTTGVFRRPRPAHVPVQPSPFRDRCGSADGLRPPPWRHRCRADAGPR